MLEPSTVVAFAAQTLTPMLPGFTIAQGDASVRIGCDEREIVWNLANIVRQAAPEWQEEVASQAVRVAAAAREAREKGVDGGVDVAFSLDDVVVLVWPEEKIRRISADWLVAEPLAEGLHLFYGVRGGGRIRNVKPEELATHGISRDVLRERAVANLGLSLESLSVGPLFEGAPVLTNHEGLAVATSIFADRAMCARLARACGGDFLVALPAPSRFFVAPYDERLVGALSSLVRRAVEMEDDLLSSRVFRVSGGAWSAVAPD
jgi:hypothetical protein